MRVLEGTVRQRAPALEAAGRTWDAQWGTLVATATEGFQRATQPLFAALTSGLGGLNGVLTANGPAIESAMRDIVTAAVRAGPPLLTFASGVFDVARGFGTALAPAARALGPAVLGLAQGVGGILGTVGRFQWVMDAFVLSLRIAFAPLFLVAEAARRTAILAQQAQHHFEDNAIRAREAARLERVQRGANQRATSIRQIEAVMGMGRGDATLRGLNDKAINGLAGQAGALYARGQGTEQISATLAAHAEELRNSNTARSTAQTLTPNMTLRGLAGGAGAGVVVNNTIHQTVGAGADPDAVAAATAEGAEHGTRAAVARTQRTGARQ
jgi:hypothetical protein